MNQRHFRQHFDNHLQESRQVWHAPIVLLHIIKINVKVALIGAVALLAAAIISSCNGSEPISTLTSSPTATSCPQVATPTVSPRAIFVGDTLATCYDMGVNTYKDLTNWVTVKSGEICMAYPSGQSWGNVFLTVGKPTQPPRPGEDLSSYHKLFVELQGQTGSKSVSIGLKDNTAPDDGSEAKVLKSNLTTDWKSFTIPLSQFKDTDLHKLYVVIEFVFADKAATVCARNIQYLP